MVADGPLTGVRVLVPRPPHQASALSARIAAAGGDPIEAATIRTVAGDAAALAAAVAELGAGGFVAVCLTSANGVAALADAFAAAGSDPAVALRRCAWIGAVGPRTAAVAADRLGVTPDVVPQRATGEDLGAAVPSRLGGDGGAGRVLLPRGDLARPELEEALTAAGYVPAPVVAYRTVAAASLQKAVVDELTSGSIDLVAATAGSTVRGLVTLLEGRALRAGVVSIGPITTAVCHELGVEVVAEAASHDLDGLLDALVVAARRA